MNSSFRPAEEERIRRAYARRQRDQRYSWFDPAYLLMVQERERRLVSLMKREGLEPLESKTILEIGCGTGGWLRDFMKWGARPEKVSGIDLLPDRIEEARRLCPASMSLYVGNASNLPFPDATFDLVLQSTVFTSILDQGMKRQVAAEMIRVLRNNGAVLWYDFHVNNPWNRDVRGVKKSEIRELFPRCLIKLTRITLAPPVSRALAPSFGPFCYALGKIPWLCSHYLGTIRKL